MPDQPISEWIARVLPLRPGDTAHHRGVQDGAELARFRIRIIGPPERPSRRIPGPRVGAVNVGPVRLLCLDSVNPHGGVGGSLDSDQCAWLVRELDAARDHYVVLASHDGSRTMTSDVTPRAAAPRVLGDEVVSLLLAHRHVIGWISGTMHERAGRRHGDHGHGFWELPGATSGLGAPLAGGLSVRVADRHLHRVVAMQGALGGTSVPVWEVPDPATEVSERALRDLVRA